MLRLATSALVGVFIGLGLWSSSDPSAPAEPWRDAIGNPGSPEMAGPGFLGGDEYEGVRRDHRPPHAPRVPATPPLVEIPAIGVRAHVAPLGKTRSGALDVPDNWSVVGRWRGGSRPGAPGAAVLVGHVDSQSRPAVFHRLKELRRGDLVSYVARDGTTAEFVVVRTQQTSKASFPTARVYGDTEEPTLRLITCGGSFDWSRGHYRDNVIVYAEKR